MAEKSPNGLFSKVLKAFGLSKSHQVSRLTENEPSNRSYSRDVKKNNMASMMIFHCCQNIRITYIHTHQS